MEKSCIDGFNKKQKVEDTQDSVAEISLDWLHVLFSDYSLPSALQYLTLKYIAKLDTAICNRNGRAQWLESLEKHLSSASTRFLKWNNELVEWIVVKKLHFESLEIHNGYSRISNENIYRLAKQCPDLRKLNIMYEDEDGYSSGDDIKCYINLQYLITYCYKLQSIELYEFPLSLQHCFLLGKCGQLGSMKISSCIFSSTANMEAIFKNKKKLKVLELPDSCLGDVLFELGTNRLVTVQCLLLSICHSVIFWMTRWSN